MVGWLGIGVAVAGKWDGVSADVVASRVLPVVDAAAITDLVSDLSTFAAVFPSDCATGWELLDRTAGVGARARVRYTVGPLRRRLVAVVRKDEPGNVFELEHEGRKGFFTQVRTERAEGGVLVTMATFLEPPPWPFRGVFYRNVHPVWVACHERTIDALGVRLGLSIAPSPVPR